MLAHSLSVHLVLTAASLLVSATPRASCPGEPGSPAQPHARVERATATEQDPTPEQYAALLRAMVVLKIAPYLNREGSAKKDTDATPYRIAVVGEDDVGTAMMQHLGGKPVGKRLLQVVAIGADEIAEEGVARRFDLAYVARPVPRETVERLVAALREVPTPLVADRPGFCASGGGVQLSVHDNAVRFEINAEVLKKQGVKASSQLLKLSRRGPRR